MNLSLDLLDKLIAGISTWSKDVHSLFMIKRFSDFDTIIEKISSSMNYLQLQI